MALQFKEKVLITRKIPQEGIDLLEQNFNTVLNPFDRPFTREELIRNMESVNGVLCLLTDRIDAELMDMFPKVRGYANYAVGFDNIDIEAATKRGIPVSNTPDVLTNATAEMAWALLFSVARRVVEADGVTRSGLWEGWGPLQFIGGDVTGKTLGILGGGRIGVAMAEKSVGFKMEVLYTDVKRNEFLEKTIGACFVTFDELLRRSDYISIHVPLNEDTRHLFGEESFKKMKKTAYMINTSRGPVVDEKALLKALRNNEIAGAAIDVFEYEPRMTAGLEKLANLVVTPHIASATKESRTNMALKAAQNLIAMLKGDLPPDCVNPKVFS